MTVHSSVLDLIGDTPMVDISALSPHPGARILIKLEGQNPAGSVKDRIAKAMVEEAEADGTLAPGRTIIEPSSGNTGIALAMIARIRGYPIKVVLPENVSVERRQMLKVFGAEIISSPGDEGSNGAVRLARQLADENPDWVFLYQYANEANPRVHYETTGPEILADVPDITHFVAGLGTSGTLMGVGTYLKEQRPEVQVLAVEPPSGEMVQGLRSLDDGYIPPTLREVGWQRPCSTASASSDPSSPSSAPDASPTSVGSSSASRQEPSLAGALKVSESLDDAEQATIVLVASDAGWKYLSTGAWTADLDEAVANAGAILYF